MARNSKTKAAKPLTTKTIADGDIELSFYSFERKEGITYTCAFKIMDAFVAYTRVIKGRNGWFISYPSYETKSGEFKDYIFCVDKDINAEIDLAVKEFADEYID